MLLYKEEKRRERSEYLASRKRYVYGSVEPLVRGKTSSISVS